MGSTSILPALCSRRRLAARLALALALVLGLAGGVFAQDAQPQQQQPAPGMAFSADAGMVFNIIKPDKTADFEMVMGKLKEALQKSEDPTRKQQAAGWKIFKSVEPGPNGNVLYLSIMDPVVKGADYTVSKILSEVFPEEALALYQKYSDAFVGGLSRTNLTVIQRFGGGSAGAPEQ